MESQREILSINQNEIERKPMSEAMGRIAVLARVLVEQDAAVEAAEQLLSDAKAAKLKTQREDLPELLREFGMDEFKLTDGTKITIKDDVEARITEENRHAAHAWLVANGAGGMIKSEVIVPFGREHVAEANALLDELNNRSFVAGIKENVHAMTLKAYIREQIAKGVAVPFDLFSITPFSFATVKLPKSEK
jgi:hypothetical protein